MNYLFEVQGASCYKLYDKTILARAQQLFRNIIMKFMTQREQLLMMHAQSATQS